MYGTVLYSTLFSIFFNFFNFFLFLSRSIQNIYVRTVHMKFDVKQKITVPYGRTFYFFSLCRTYVAVPFYNFLKYRSTNTYVHTIDLCAQRTASKKEATDIQIIK